MGFLQSIFNRNKPEARLALAYHFNVNIRGYNQGNFLKISGLSGELETFDYREGGENSTHHQLPDAVRWGDITLVKGTVKEDSDLWHWFKTVFQLEGYGSIKAEGQGIGFKPVFYKDISIDALDNDNEVIFSYKIFKAFVKSIQPGEFDSMTSAVHVTQAVLGCHGIDMSFPLPKVATDNLKSIRRLII
jgi:phage tail-like protein